MLRLQKSPVLLIDKCLKCVGKYHGRVHFLYAGNASKFSFLSCSSSSSLGDKHRKSVTNLKVTKTHVQSFQQPLHSSFKQQTNLQNTMANLYTKHLTSAKIYSFQEMTQELELIARELTQTPHKPNNEETIKEETFVKADKIQLKSTLSAKDKQDEAPAVARVRLRAKRKKATLTVGLRNDKLFQFHPNSIATLMQVRNLCSVSEDNKGELSPPLPIDGEEATTKSRRKTQATTEDLKKTQKIFPHPKYSLNHCFMTIATYLRDNSFKITPMYNPVPRNGKTIWECTYVLRWPQEMRFTAIGITKQDASTRASILALHNLFINNNITKNNLPVLPEQQREIKALTNKLVSLPIREEVVSLMHGIVTDYQEMVKELSTKVQKPEVDDKQVLDFESEDIWPINEAKKQVNMRNAEFFSTREEKLLPISDYKAKIIDIVRNNRVVVIKGEPGCGKSTRVPQYILEGWAKSFAGDDCRIVVTQPRRIAAISLAERVAAERNEGVGPTIGYQVRLNSNFNRHTGKILYCTTGILLRRLQSDPSLRDCTHVILDEAHERDVNTDLLLSLLKHALEMNGELKLLVMSATIKAEAFQEYFQQAEIFHVPGFTYPVTVKYLDEGKRLDATWKMCHSDSPDVIHEDVAKLLHFIHTSKPEGAILTFLPGWEDIIKVKRLIPEKQELKVLCLHSRMPHDEQKLIFSKFPPGVRKIILTTNIAETSVTIDDVVYVVDSGIQKEKRFDNEKGINIIDNHWISKASMAQRKGRAGRCRSGEAFLLYPKEKFNTFHEYSIPEIQRTSLTKIVLDCKVYSNNMKASEFLGQLITPPDESAIYRAVDELIELELLDEDENLTPLGRVISDFQLEPKLAKALVNSVIYKCVTPIVDIVTYFSAEMEIFAGGLSDREWNNKMKRRFSQSSDHLSVMRLLEQWLDLAENGNSQQAYTLCKEYNLVDHKMRTLQKLRNIHFDYLRKGLHDILPMSDDYSDSDELVKAVLLSGVGTVLHHRNYEYLKGRLVKKNVLLTRHNHKATISSDSVNYKRGVFPTDFMLYINETRSNIRRMTVVRETSLVLPLTVLLFKNNALVVEPLKPSHSFLDEDVAKFKEPVVIMLDGTQIIFVAEREHAELLQQCREAISSGVEYYIYQLTKGAEYDRRVNKIWDRILKQLNECLKSEANRIAL